MVGLVLDAPGEQPVAREDVRHPGDVLELRGDPDRALDVPAMSGNDRQPSSTACSAVPSATLTVGFARTSGMKRSRGGRTPSSSQSNSASLSRRSATHNWIARPNCWAAKPIPPASCMVSIIESANSASAASNTAIFSPFLRKTGLL